MKFAIYPNFIDRGIFLAYICPENLSSNRIQKVGEITAPIIEGAEITNIHEGFFKVEYIGRIFNLKYFFDQAGFIYCEQLEKTLSESKVAESFADNILNENFDFSSIFEEEIVFEEPTNQNNFHFIPETERKEFVNSFFKQFLTVLGSNDPSVADFNKQMKFMLNAAKNELLSLAEKRDFSILKNSLSYDKKILTELFYGKTNIETATALKEIKKSNKEISEAIKKRFQVEELKFDFCSIKEQLLQMKDFLNENAQLFDLDNNNTNPLFYMHTLFVLEDQLDSFADFMSNFPEYDKFCYDGKISNDKESQNAIDVYNKVRR